MSTKKETRRSQRFNRRKWKQPFRAMLDRSLRTAIITSENRSAKGRGRTRPASGAARTRGGQQ